MVERRDTEENLWQDWPSADFAAFYGWQGALDWEP